MYIQVNKTCLYYDKRGTGYPLILVHGNGEDHHIFDELVEKLQKHFMCYLVDSRNHGLSEMTDQYHYHVMADDIKTFIDVLKLDKPLFFGFSDGGIIGVLLTIKHPHLLKSMMLLGTNIYPKGIKKTVRDDMTNRYLETKDPLLKMMIEEPHIRWNDLHQIVVPTCVVVGEYDIIYQKHTHAMIKHISSSHLVIIPKKNHDDYIVHRDDLYELILSYWNENRLD